jgi:hypothetical protein
MRASMIAAVTLFTAVPVLAHSEGAYVASAARAPEVLSVRADLQGLYDEISQAGFQFESGTDVDLFHDVLYTPDWMFVNAAGQPHGWSQEREQVIQSLNARPYASMIQALEKLSLIAGGATADVTVTTVRTIVDEPGRYGRKGETRTLVETTMFRDAWVNAAGEWKLRARRQIGQPKVVIEKGKPGV